MRKIALVMLLFVVLTSHFNAIGQDAKFQALIMYNFTKLLDWPDKSGDFVINVIDNVELAKELADFTATRKAGGIQNIVVNEILTNELTKCQMVFVGASESDKLDEIIKKTEGNNTLLITEKNGLTEEGAGISFVKKNGAWKFEFNELNIKKQDLKVSSDFKELGIAK
ncbi:MAG: hypothetical protein DRJ10_13685 [Bacteroidetes bacterium]|nr:MAG: hypothetical protein DRJ10_13685 [Bacteroidota bacterium]